MTKYIFANWKSNKTSTEVQTWAKNFTPFWQKFIGEQVMAAEQNLKIAVCPSFLHIAELHALLPSLPLGAQTLSPFPNGAYTGAVSALMLKEYIQYVILGHVERRQFFGETDQMVANQVIQALDNGLTPILAVNDVNWATQLSQLTAEQLRLCLIMYEPPEAISTNGQGHPADLEQVIAASQLILNNYQVRGVLYGGSVTADNIKIYLSESVISGAVVGNASLDADEFAKLLSAL